MVPSVHSFKAILLCWLAHVPTTERLTSNAVLLNEWSGSDRKLEKSK